MEFATRLGTETDVAALEPLWAEMLEHHRGLVRDEWPVRAAAGSWAIRAAHYTQWLNDATGILVIADRPGSPEPLGYAMCKLRASGPTFDLGPEFAEVEDLVVLAAARGSGIGTALLNACRRQLRSRGITHWSIGVLDANEGATALYRRLGFRPWERLLLAPVDDGDR